MGFAQAIRTCSGKHRFFARPDAPALLRRPPLRAQPDDAEAPRPGARLAGRPHPARRLRSLHPNSCIFHSGAHPAPGPLRRPFRRSQPGPLPYGPNPLEVTS
ncbi:hypothetical protein SAMN05444006_101156 [Allgaiera indica]|uniref:Uncharacterized protein n=1 Tax=Allgaiera indica TaxID=765699 RepID=A0A1H2QFL6_9RHOB|nr:hypothetical protein SAMN05444006_101156 [Allgaiera indica]